MLRNKLLNALTLSVCTLLGACSFAPGLHIDQSALSAEANEANGMIDVIPITAKLLAVDSATRTKPGIPEELLAFRPAPYKIGSGDILQVIVWDHPELSMPIAPSLPTEEAGAPAVSGGGGQSTGFLVDEAGNIHFPYAGKVRAAGRSPQELAADLQSRIKEWIAQPQITVNSMRMNSTRVTLSGAFDKTQDQVIPAAKLTLASALGNAGIKAQDADYSGLTLRRDGRDYVLDLDELSSGGGTSLGSIFLKNGDHIHLPFNNRRKIYVMGEVFRPTSIAFNTRSIPLAEAISLAGGVRQETASAQAIYVVRGEEAPQGKPTQIFHLDARTPVSLALAARFEVKPQDVVFIGPAGVTRWNRLITQLLPSGQIFYMGASAANQVTTLRQ